MASVEQQENSGVLVPHGTPETFDRVGVNALRYSEG